MRVLKILYCPTEEMLIREIIPCFNNFIQWSLLSPVLFPAGRAHGSPKRMSSFVHVPSGGAHNSPWKLFSLWSKVNRRYNILRTLYHVVPTCFPAGCAHGSPRKISSFVHVPSGGAHNSPWKLFSLWSKVNRRYNTLRTLYHVVPTCFPAGRAHGSPRKMSSFV